MNPAMQGLVGSPPQRTNTTYGAATPWGWAAAGASMGLLFATLAFAPAQWLAQGIQRLSDDRVQLLAPQGTAWRGSAQLALSAGHGSRVPTALPGRVQWQLGPSWEGITLALNTDCCLPQPWLWTLSPIWGGLRVRPSDQPAAQPSRWPSALLAGLGTPWNTLQLQGSLALSSQQLEFQWQPAGWHLAGRAQLDASQISSSLSTLKPMGSYRLALEGGPAPTLHLSTLEGSLQLSGTGHWEQGRLRFEGEASAAPERAEALANLLNIIGRRDGVRSIIKVG
jgi:general secretion pathway protein N